MEYEIPKELAIKVGQDALTVSAKGVATKVKFNSQVMKVAEKGGKLEITAWGSENRTKRAAMISLTKHIDNVAKGANKPFEKSLTVIYAHFPVSVEVKGKEIFIKNFLGEKLPRKAAISGNAAVKVNGQEITVTGANKDEVGQTAANLVSATRITNKDRRVFQDGIYYSE
ncbi:MAG: 50S ribosomal protein L6 [Candidatus Micrarchaeota archaeon]